MVKKHFTRIRKNIILSSITGILASFSMILSSLLIKRIVDAVVAGDMEQVKSNSLYFLIILIFDIIAVHITQYVYQLMNFTSSFQLREAMFKNILQKDIKETNNIKQGDIITSLTSDTDKIATFYGIDIAKFAMFSFKAAMTIGIITYYNPYVSLFSVICVVICAFLSKKLSKKIGEKTVDLQKITGVEHNNILQSIEGSRTIKQLNKEEYFYQEYKNTLDEKYNLSRNLAKIYALYADVILFAYNILPFATILISIFFVTKGTMTVGDLVAIMAIAGALTEPISGFGSINNDRNIAKSLVEKNKSFLDDNSHSILPTKAYNFNNLEFSSDGYSFGEREILKDLNFKFERGKIYTIVGQSGTGKSTIYNLISKFIDENDVKININGEPISEYTPSDIYTNIKQVDQKAVTLNKSVLENITLGDSYSQDEIDEVIKVSQLEDFKNTKGLDFIIDDRGQNVSGGEKQRISIARILLRKPQLLLLDEPTSALDEKTSKNLVQDLIEFCKKYKITLVAITHRDDFTKMSDEIIEVK